MKKLALFALLACASASFAQPWMQPWTPNLPAFESRVFNCNNSNTPGAIAMDDFTVNATAWTVTAINWWGTISQPAQMNRPYYIAIYRDMGCMPDMANPVFRICIRPQAQPVGADCMGQQVYRFFANIPAGFLNLTNGQYWIQISEADQQSVQPGIPDFWWSSSFPVNQCPALQMFGLGTAFQILFDPCYGINVDLAFELF